MKKITVILLSVLLACSVLFAQEIDDEEDILIEDIFSEEELEEEGQEALNEDFDLAKKSIGAKFGLYLNAGPIEPWEATGGMYNMGYKGQLGFVINPLAMFSLPSVFSYFRVEGLAGYTSFVGKYDSNRKSSIISGALNARYDLTDFLLQYLGYSHPKFGAFAFGGMQFNNQTWEDPNWDIDPHSAFGFNVGVGVQIGKIDIRFIQSNFLMDDVVNNLTETPIYSYEGEQYKHAENGFLFGFMLPIGGKK